MSCDVYSSAYTSVIMVYSMLPKVIITLHRLLMTALLKYITKIYPSDLELTVLLEYIMESMLVSKFVCPCFVLFICDCSIRVYYEFCNRHMANL